MNPTSKQWRKIHVFHNVACWVLVLLVTPYNYALFEIANMGGIKQLIWWAIENDLSWYALLLLQGILYFILLVSNLCNHILLLFKWEAILGTERCDRRLFCTLGTSIFISLSSI